jgi:hypothetical protein
VKPSPCDDCNLNAVCFGVWRKYYELHGDAELKPVPIPAGTRPLKTRFSIAPSIDSGGA